MMKARTAHKRASRAPAGRSRQSGFGIVELMVGMFLGLLIVGGAIAMYVRSQETYRTSEGLARIQENLRTAFEMMAREIRQAGGTMCGTSLVANRINDDPSTAAINENAWHNWQAGTLIAYGTETDAPGVEFGTDPGDRVEDTQAIFVLSGSIGRSVPIVDHTPLASPPTMTLPDGHGFSADDIVVACDHKGGAIFQISSMSGNNVSHDIGGTPGNCHKDLGGSLDCASPSPKPFFNIASSNQSGYLTAVTAALWYIGHNGRGGHSLYRLTTSGKEEIAEGISVSAADGITGLRVDYLTDDGTGLSTEWQEVPEDSTSIDWSQAATDKVMAVRVTLNLQSLANISIDNTPLQRTLVFVANLRSRTT